jgi:hypothetical protein
MNEQSQEQIAEIWKLFKENAAQIKAIEAQFKETDARLDRRFRETDTRFRETEARFRETDARMDKRSQETEKRIREVIGMFTGQWGKMIEVLVEPEAVGLFQERGIPVKRVFRRAESQLNGRSMELDLLLENDDIVMVVEVKSTLRVEDVRHFLDKLNLLPLFFPRYADYHIYAAVAGMDILEGADRFAYRQGLFVLGFIGESIVKILNDASFSPRDFSGFSQNVEDE